MSNLLAETLYILQKNGKTPEDVVWVGDNEKHTSFKDFVTNADRKYDSGYGGAEVYSKLLIVGEDWWLERGEYDGSEWWEFKSPPKKPTQEGAINSMFCDYHDEEFWSK